MIAGQRLQRISGIALPLIAGAVATNLMTFVDTLMVGQLGDAALGGVGLGGQLFFLFLAVVLGLAAGVQAMVARRVGEGRLELTGKLLNAGLLLGVVVGGLLITASYVLMPLILRGLNVEAAVVDEGLAYLDTRIPSLLLMALTLSFRAYWVGVSLAKWSMVAIVSLSLANIVFNYILIFGNFGAPRMEVAGAGLGSTLAVLVGVLVNAGLALRFARRNGFLKGLPDPQQIRTIGRISYPESLRQAFFSLGVVLLYALIGQIGVRELAAFHVVISICQVAYMPHIGFGGAATTLVGEALGRSEAKNAKTWGWQVSNVAVTTLFLLGAAVLLFPQPWLQLFLVDEATLALAIIPLQISVLAHILDGYGKVLGSALIGAGATAAAMRLTVLPQWLLMLPLIALSVYLGYGLSTAMGIFAVSALVAAVLFAATWHREKWQDTHV